MFEVVARKRFISSFFFLPTFKMSNKIMISSKYALSTFCGKFRMAT